MTAFVDQDFLGEVIDSDGIVHTDQLAGCLRTTKAELAATLGLSRDAVSKTSRAKTRATQGRLREATQIINRVLPWSGSLQQAFAWYRSQPLPAFGDQTAEELVRDGRAEHVMSYLAGLSVGGYA
jgi:hypothetical protein